MQQNIAQYISGLNPEERANLTMKLWDRLKTYTKREGECIDLLLMGCCDKDIGERLGISPRTVKQHMSRLYERLGIRSENYGCPRVKLAMMLIGEPEQAEITLPRLTGRDLTIIRLVTKALSNREIAALTVTTEQVIKNRLKVINDVTGTSSRLELSLWAARAGVRRSHGPAESVPEVPETQAGGAAAGAD